ncbi:FAD-dependent oxidoreductase [bacterium]|nr:FAD-dependent oxidoreductase [bacterium]
MSIADQHRVPARKALAVDREAFAAEVTEAVETGSLIEIIRDEYSHIDAERLTVVASGPLTSDSLAQELLSIIGGEASLLLRRDRSWDWCRDRRSLQRILGLEIFTCRWRLP